MLGIHRCYSLDSGLNHLRKSKVNKPNYKTVDDSDVGTEALPTRCKLGKKTYRYSLVDASNKNIQGFIGNNATTEAETRTTKQGKMTFLTWLKALWNGEPTDSWFTQLIKDFFSKEQNNTADYQRSALHFCYSPSKMW